MTSFKPCMSLPFKELMLTEITQTITRRINHICVVLDNFQNTYNLNIRFRCDFIINFSLITSFI